MKPPNLPYILATGFAIALCQCNAIPKPTPIVAPARSDEVARRVSAESDPLHPQVKIETSLGDMVVKLDGEAAPATVLNFMHAVGQGFYSNTVFHRVLQGEMIQGGGYTPDIELKFLTKPLPFPDDWHGKLTNVRGTFALIRGTGPARKRAAEFFINVADNPRLDNRENGVGHIVIGRVVEGMDTADLISNVHVSTHENYAANRSRVVPDKPVMIRSIQRLTAFDPIKVQALTVVDTSHTDEQVAALIARLEKEHETKAVKTESGLKYVDLEIGRGPSPLPTDTIEFHYRGTLLDGTEFESTLWRDAASKQVSKLITGLKEAISTMNEGGRLTIVIPPELGYGAQGIPGHIPADATLVFEIELLAIE